MNFLEVVFISLYILENKGYFGVYVFKCLCENPADRCRCSSPLRKSVPENLHCFVVRFSTTPSGSFI